MASGHVNRANRPNTWLLRPTPQSEDSTCQPGAVHTWLNASFVATKDRVALRAKRIWSTLSAPFSCLVEHAGRQAAHRAARPVDQE